PAPAVTKPPMTEAAKETLKPVSRETLKERAKEAIREAAKETPKEAAKETRAATPPPPPPPPLPLPTSEIAALQPMIEQHALETARMRTELGGLRQLLEQQLSSLAWNDME